MGDPWRGMATAAVVLALQCLDEPEPLRWAPPLGCRGRKRVADPEKKAARKRQKKARAITRKAK